MLGKDEMYDADIAALLVRVVRLPVAPVYVADVASGIDESVFQKLEMSFYLHNKPCKYLKKVREVRLSWLRR